MEVIYWEKPIDRRHLVSAARKDPIHSPFTMLQHIYELGSLLSARESSHRGRHVRVDLEISFPSYDIYDSFINMIQKLYRHLGILNSLLHH
jgi:hypothetical protein